MPFGFTNSPAKFQNLTNFVQHRYLDVCAMVYFDNILVFFRNPEPKTQAGGMKFPGFIFLSTSANNYSLF
ncbi:hypothetical protein LIPSTDRAFT_144983 [Lipomyces starkeyi NRRL Y-11557]|uniref:Reverse transcriptase domain-containing protein n=1 Tax=Lipomyces starkeyi NRRL Y-11557 TaxID=675824 RepID=A0A1E3QGV9_LIPST|nr:hypothetical protein LIPSTDRAFT_144983 [Lipomyces starkeyi NRRL Y-11557]